MSFDGEKLTPGNKYPRGPDYDHVERMIDNSRSAAEFLKALSHEGRLMILIHLAQQERSVGELEQLLGLRQSAVSQQLARLRLDGLVVSRRSGKTVYYSILDPRVRRLVSIVQDIFAPDIE